MCLLLILLTIQAANSNDCDELYDVLKSRVEELQLKSVSSINKEFEEGENTKFYNENCLLKCECQFISEETEIEGELSVYKNEKLNSLIIGNEKSFFFLKFKFYVKFQLLNQLKIKKI